MKASIIKKPSVRAKTSLLELVLKMKKDMDDRIDKAVIKRIKELG